MLYFSTKSKVKAKKKPGWKQAEAEYQQWLASHGAVKKRTSNQQPDRSVYVPPVSTYVPRTTEKYSSLVTKPDMHACAKKVSSHMASLTGTYTIGQAYNKGNLQVLTPTECKDSATGKRRP